MLCVSKRGKGRAGAMECMHVVGHNLRRQNDAHMPCILGPSDMIEICALDDFNRESSEMIGHPYSSLVAWWQAEAIRVKRL